MQNRGTTRRSCKNKQGLHHITPRRQYFPCVSHFCFTKLQELPQTRDLPRHHRFATSLILLAQRTQKLFHTSLHDDRLAGSPWRYQSGDTGRLTTAQTAIEQQTPSRFSLRFTFLLHKTSGITTNQRSTSISSLRNFLHLGSANNETVSYILHDDRLAGSPWRYQSGIPAG